MNAPLTEPSSLPDWMIIFAFTASLVLTILKIGEGILSAVRKSTLEVALTREVFFRIFDTGEALYTNAVLVAYGVGALIKDIRASLKKEDGATKEFTLRVAQIGEKFRSAEGFYQFSFYSSSPLAFIPENNPQRQVYICEHLSYSDATKQEFQRFQQALFQIKEKYNPVPTEDVARAAELVSELNDTVAAACASVMDKIQLEPGRYTLSLTVTYRQKGRYLPISVTKTARSGIQFVVEDYAREFLRSSVSEYLGQKAVQFLLNKTDTLRSPEYAPTSVVEL
jgi:hypothetical protein